MKREIYTRKQYIEVGEWVEIVEIHPDDSGFPTSTIREYHKEKIGRVVTQLRYKFLGWFGGQIRLEDGKTLTFGGVRVLETEPPSKLPEGYKPNCMVVR